MIIFIVIWLNKLILYCFTLKLYISYKLTTFTEVCKIISNKSATISARWFHTTVFLHIKLFCFDACGFVCWRHIVTIFFCDKKNNIFNKLFCLVCFCFITYENTYKLTNNLVFQKKLQIITLYQNLYTRMLVFVALSDVYQKDVFIF